MTDLETFETELREMLARRAEDIIEDAEVVVLATPQARDRHWRRRVGIVAAVAMAAAGLGVGLAVSRDQTDDTDLTATTSKPSTAIPGEDQSGSQGDSAIVQNPGRPVVAWGTSAPSADQLPLDYQLGPGDPIYRGDPAATPDAVVDEYLKSRFRGEFPPGFAAAFAETVGPFTLYRWEWQSFPGGEGEGGPSEGEAGWIYLRQGDDAWMVIAATTDGVDLSSLVSDGEGLRGRVISTSANGFSLEAVVADGSGQELLGSGELYASDSVVGLLDFSADVGPNQVQVRVQHVGGTWLSITELVMPQIIRDIDLVVVINPAADDGLAVAEQLDADPMVLESRRLDPSEAQAMYTTVLFRGPRLARVWADEAGLIVYLVALRNGTVLADVTSAYESTTGVLVAAPLEPALREQVLEPPTPKSADEPVDLIVASEVVAAPRVPSICLAPFGIQVPPNEVVVVREPLVADTPAEALALFLARSGPRPPWREGFVEFVGPDGLVSSYGYRSDDGLLVGVIRIRDQSGTSFGVYEWETSAC